MDIYVYWVDGFMVAPYALCPRHDPARTIHRGHAHNMIRGEAHITSWADIGI
ncbi:hypothetical protein PGTUg99_011219 [Puccinia graminis f. sp. tritici]|uniref:Uncharacterized protein n=1 Tax=Puccinia graminis f. sp. tritici TaxID=56615 RepID=A0A5B0RZF4_PUCGR|nr:hypothetical protein PGTUg99_011219 [Puccinia graminis f. sp. tritici]